MGLSVGMVLSTGETVVEVRNGGFAEVGVLEDEFEGKKVIKRIKDDVLDQPDDAAASAFFHECKIWVHKLRGAPHVAPALQAFRNLDELGPVLFVSYVDGPVLRELLRAGRQSLCQTVRMGGQMASAIAKAHESDIRHRDLKPSNVMVDTDNQIQVIDWGLSRAHTGTNLTVGVVDYLSPERRADPRVDDPADDIYALGVILFESLTGGYPREAADKYQLRAALASAHPLAPASVLELLCRMLADSPTERPVAREIVDALRSPELLADLAAREVEHAFCKACQFVAASGEQMVDCPICGRDMYERYASPPRDGMVRIPTGVFIHGLNQNQARQALIAAGVTADQGHLDLLAPPDDEPREVFVPGFDIDMYPVTNEDYLRFVEATNYPMPEGLLAARSTSPDHPVTQVTWRDALCYALWAEKRLPNPLEREKAARGDKDNRTYPWGDVWQEKRCNHSRLPGAIWRTTSPVTAFTSGESDGRSPFGVAGMAGNVGEWISHSRATQAQGRDAETRAVCGGGWSDPVPVYGAVSMQISAAIDYKSESVGFRCAADIIYAERSRHETSTGHTVPPPVHSAMPFS